MSSKYLLPTFLRDKTVKQILEERSAFNVTVGTPEVYLNNMQSILTGKSFDINKADTISTVYTCIKTLSDTISRMPLNVYVEDENGMKVDKADYRYSLLHYNPNNYTSSQTFFASLEYWRNLKGNSFARIWRNNRGEAISFELLKPSQVVGHHIHNNELYYKVNDNNDKEIILPASEILHFTGLTRDGIWGINPIESLRLNVSTTWQGLNTIDSFYRNNLSSPKAIKSTVSGANQKAMQDAVKDLSVKYAGSTQAGQILVLPPNTDIVDMQLNFTDAEFINTLKFNATQIAALYGVPASLVGILEATKFNNVELMMNEFKAMSLTAIARMYRQELEFKLLTTEERLNGKSIEFNLMALVEADSIARYDNYSKAINAGWMAPNYAAKKEGLPTFEGGDKHFRPLNYTTSEDAADDNAIQVPL